MQVWSQSSKSKQAIRQPASHSQPNSNVTRPKAWTRVVLAAVPQLSLKLTSPLPPALAFSLSLSLIPQPWTTARSGICLSIAPAYHCLCTPYLHHTPTLAVADGQANGEVRHTLNFVLSAHELPTCLHSHHHSHHPLPAGSSLAPKSPFHTRGSTCMGGLLAYEARQYTAARHSQNAVWTQSGRIHEISSTKQKALWPWHAACGLPLPYSPLDVCGCFCRPQYFPEASSWSLAATCLSHPRGGTTSIFFSTLVYLSGAFSCIGGLSTRSLQDSFISFSGVNLIVCVTPLLPQGFLAPPAAFSYQPLVSHSRCPRTTTTFCAVSVDHHPSPSSPLTPRLPPLSPLHCSYGLPP